jgi:hypothetical protein
MGVTAPLELDVVVVELEQCLSVTFLDRTEHGQHDLRVARHQDSNLLVGGQRSGDYRISIP